MRKTYFSDLWSEKIVSIFVLPEDWLMAYAVSPATGLIKTKHDMFISDLLHPNNANRYTQIMKSFPGYASNEETRHSSDSEKWHTILNFWWFSYWKKEKKNTYIPINRNLFKPVSLNHFSLLGQVYDDRTRGNISHPTILAQYKLIIIICLTGLHHI